MYLTFSQKKGHDWGGAVGYAFTSKYPNYVKQYITINIPHPKSLERERDSSLKQKLMSWYMVFFQCPKLPEIFFSSSDFVILDDITKDAKGDDEMAEAYKYAFRSPGGQKRPNSKYSELPTFTYNFIL